MKILFLIFAITEVFGKSLPTNLELIPEEYRPLKWTTSKHFKMPTFNKPGYRLTCHQCENVKSEAECDKNIVTCANNALSCQTHIRIWNGGKVKVIMIIYLNIPKNIDK